MGDESISLERARFDICDLGLLDGATEREFDIITRNAGIILQGSASIFCVLDPARAAVFLRSSYAPRGDLILPERFAISQSLFAQLINAGRSCRIANIGEHPEFEDCFEPTALPFRSALSVPVYGPAREQIGALVVLSDMPREWDELERIELADQAHLLSRHVLLRASLETLKRVSRERTSFSNAQRFPH